MKKCSKCGVEKSRYSFQNSSENRDGLQSWCSLCMNKSSKDRSRTKSGVACSAFRHQIKHSKTRNHDLPKYTKAELKEWMLSSPDFNILYRDWVISGYDKSLKPSIDRLDDYKGYSFDNIRVVTWVENNRKAHRDMINGVNNKQSKQVVQLKNGVVIGEYYSLMNAFRSTGIDYRNISRACLNELTAGGFEWRYK